MRKPFIACAGLAVLLFLLALFLKEKEFLIYGVTAIVTVAILYKTDELFHYPSYALWGFAAWIVLHTLGGFAYIGDVRLYDFIILDLVGEPFSILKYDQLVHFYTYVVIGLLLCRVVDSIVRAKASPLTVGVIVVLAAIGIGGINEIIEFMPVVLFNAPGPGGYENTVLDLIMNSFGAIAAVLFYYRH